MNIQRTQQYSHKKLYIVASLVAVIIVVVAITRMGNAKVVQDTWQQLSAASSHTCALASDNKAYCWGGGGNGQLGNGTTTNKSTPTLVSQGDLPQDTHFTHISAGGAHTCALASDNKAYCWGYGYAGQLGNGTTTNKSTPTRVSQGDLPQGTHFTHISAASSHTCALASDNKAYCWGYGYAGQLGNGTTDDRYTPVATQSPLFGIRVAQNTARLYQPSNNTTPGAPLPVTDATAALPDVASDFRLRVGMLNKEETPFTHISAGDLHTCALASDNKAYCWGGGGNGRLGNGTTTDKSTPTRVSQGDLPQGTHFTHISAGFGHTCALASDNKAYCWG